MEVAILFLVQGLVMGIPGLERIKSFFLLEHRNILRLFLNHLLS